MTLFAVSCAGLYPLLHMGRPWLDYWMFPYPNTMGIWPQFRSPLMWDVFAISTYATVSLLFWFVGLIPDLATLRDRANNRLSQIIYGIFAMGWRGSAKHWHRYETAYLLLAGLATPLVVSVHTIVSFDFAVGYHSRMARNYFPTLFRCRCDLRRVRHGSNSFHSDSRCLWIGRLHHHATSSKHGQNHVGNRPARCVWLHDGNLHGLVQRQSIRKIHDLESHYQGPYSKLYWALIFCNVVVAAIRYGSQKSGTTSKHFSPFRWW